MRPGVSKGDMGLLVLRSALLMVHGVSFHLNFRLVAFGHNNADNITFYETVWSSDEVGCPAWTITVTYSLAHL